MNVAAWCALGSLLMCAVSFRNLVHTLRAFRRTARSYARIRAARDAATGEYAELVQQLTHHPYCTRCALPYNTVGPDRYEHPYCPENLVTV